MATLTRQARHHDFVLNYFATISKRSTTADTLRDLLVKNGFKVRDLDPSCRTERVKTRYCVICGKVVKKPQVTFCSDACVTYFITHFQWAGIVRTILARDQHKCLDCGAVACDVHHLKRLKDGGTNDYGNLISVCHACHKKRHAEMFLAIREAKRKIKEEKALQDEKRRMGNTVPTSLDKFLEA